MFPTWKWLQHQWLSLFCGKYVIEINQFCSYNFEGRKSNHQSDLTKLKLVLRSLKELERMTSIRKISFLFASHQLYKKCRLWGKNRFSTDRIFVLNGSKKARYEKYFAIKDFFFLLIWNVTHKKRNASQWVEKNCKWMLSTIQLHIMIKTRKTLHSSSTSENNIYFFCA